MKSEVSKIEHRSRDLSKMVVVVGGDLNTFADPSVDFRDISNRERFFLNPNPKAMETQSGSYLPPLGHLMGGPNSFEDWLNIEGESKVSRMSKEEHPHSPTKADRHISSPHHSITEDSPMMHEPKLPIKQPQNNTIADEMANEVTAGSRFLVDAFRYLHGNRRVYTYFRVPVRDEETDLVRSTRLNMVAA